jgi:hypothetical protein
MSGSFGRRRTISQPRCGCANGAARTERRERSGASEASIGEITADLGFCRILTGRPRRGLELLQEGIRGLRSDTSSNGQAFLARGLKKLELGAKLAGRSMLAREARDERLRLAGDIEAMDQARSADA